MDIQIDAEFQSLIPPLAAEERKQLEANLIAEGCRDPLVVWDCTLIDGHNRYEICTRLGIPFETVEKEFNNREEVADWIDANQLGRRNLHPDQMSLLRGRRYNRTKKAVPNAKGSNQHSEVNHQNDGQPTTAERLAQQHGVSKATIERDGKFADSVQKVAAVVPNIVKQVAAGLAPAKSAIVKAAALLETQPEKAKAILNGQKTLADVVKEEKQYLKEKKKSELSAVAESVENSTAASTSHRTVSVGDTWQLGKHLLFVGDTSSEDFKKLLPKHKLSFADPPYGAGKDGYDDSKFYWQHDYLMDSAEIVVVTPGIVSIFELAKLTSMPYVWSIACWISNGMTRGAIGFGNWIYAAVFSNGSIFRQKQDFCKVSISVSETEETTHTTRKPSEFMVYIIDTFTEVGDIVVDPFLGSGQTLLVCEKMDRACIGGELDPLFCESIIARWESLTGMVAVKQ